jgi:hypothetical protein
MKYALLIGINYTSAPSGQLNGCINDVNKMKHLLIHKFGYKKQNIKMLTDDHFEKPTFHNIMKEINVLLEKAKFCSDIFFHYSGHGSYIPDQDGDEADRQDECLIPLDYYKNGYITDDMIRKLFVEKLSPSCRATLVVDACHSATCFDLPYKYNKQGQEWERINDNVVPNKQIAMISGCKDSQTSSDAYLNGEFKGAMTFALTSVLEHYNYKISWKDLLNKMHELLESKHFTQKPQLSTSSAFDLEKSFIFF